jgi:hypothetical protein
MQRRRRLSIERIDGENLHWGDMDIRDVNRTMRISKNEK